MIDGGRGSLGLRDLGLARCYFGFLCSGLFGEALRFEGFLRAKEGGKVGFERCFEVCWVGPSVLSVLQRLVAAGRVNTALQEKVCSSAMSPLCGLKEYNTYRRSDALFLIPPNRGIKLGQPSGCEVREET